MADLSVPTFALTVTFNAGATDTHRWTDATVLNGQTRSEIHYKLLVYTQSTTAPSLVTTVTPDDTDPGVVAYWDSNALIDAWYQAYLIPANDFSAGVYTAGQVVYYQTTDKWYIATEDTVGSVTDPSDTVDQYNALMVELTDVNAAIGTGTTYAGYTALDLMATNHNYYTTANDIVTEALKECTHEQRKDMLDNKNYKCDCKEHDTVFALDNYLQAITTEFSLQNYMQAQDNLEKASDICANC